MEHDKHKNRYTFRMIFIILLIIASVVGAIYVSTPHHRLEASDIYYWENEDGMYKEFLADEEFHIYVTDYRIDGYTLYNQNSLRFDDALGNTLYIMQFDNVLYDDVLPTFRHYQLDSSTQYEEYKKFFEIEFPEGTYKIDFVNVSDDIIEFPILTMDGDVKSIVDDYSDYIIIPILVGLIGLLLFTSTIFKIQRHKDEDKYGYNHHKPRREKREKY